MFKLNQNANLYIAISEKVKNFLPSDFEYIKEKISICQVDPANKSDSQEVMKSEGFKVYKKSKLPADFVEIPIATKSEVQVIIWLQNFKAEADTKSCGGEIQIMST